MAQKWFLRGLQCIPKMTIAFYSRVLRSLCLGASFPATPLCPLTSSSSPQRARDRIITGTGWGSDLERRAIDCALRLGVPVAAYLDHWVNYRRRFELSGRVLLPDEIWVGDEFAMKLALDAFPEAEIKLEPNQYFSEMQRQVALAAATHVRIPGVAVLYVTEPTSAAAQKAYGDPRHWGYTEFDALDGYLSHLQESDISIARLVVRLHPAEPLVSTICCSRNIVHVSTLSRLQGKPWPRIVRKQIGSWVVTAWRWSSASSLGSRSSRAFPGMRRDCPSAVSADPLSISIAVLT